MADKTIIIEPELGIGTEFWFLQNNRIEMGLIAAYNVAVTSVIDGRSWHEQLFSRWRNKKAKNVFKYSYTYRVKLENDITNWDIQNKNGEWWIYNRRIFFSIEDLKDSIKQNKD